MCPQPEPIDLRDVVPGASIYVVSTTPRGTQDAFAAARVAADATKSRVYVIARDCQHQETKALSAIRDLPGACSPRVEILACVAKRPSDLMALLPPRAVVFIGGNSRRWWPTAEQRLADLFTRLGCRVVFTTSRVVAA